MEASPTQNSKEIVLEKREEWRRIKLTSVAQNQHYLLHEIAIDQIQKHPLLDSMVEAFNKAEGEIYEKQRVPANILACEFAGTTEGNRTMQYAYFVPEPVEIITRTRNVPPVQELVPQLLELFDWHAKHKIVLTEVRPENIYVGQSRKVYFGLFGSCTLKDFITNLNISKESLSAYDRIKRVMETRPTLAPEMIAGLQDSSSTQAIVYNIGAILSRVYLGAFPALINSNTIVEERQPNLITAKNIPPLRPVFSNEQPDLSKVLVEMVETDPSKRMTLEEFSHLFRQTIIPKSVDFTNLPPGMFRGQGPQTCKYFFEHVLNLIKYWKEFADSLRNTLQELRLKDDKLFRLYISSMMLVSASFGHSMTYLLKHLTNKRMFTGLTESDEAYRDEAWLRDTKSRLQQLTSHMRNMIDLYEVSLDRERSAITIKLCKFETASWNDIDDYKKRVFYASISKCADYSKERPQSPSDTAEVQKLLGKIFWFVEYERVFPLFIVQNSRNEGVKFDWSHVGMISDHPQPGKIITELNRFGEIYKDQIERTISWTAGNQTSSQFGASQLPSGIQGQRIESNAPGPWSPLTNQVPRPASQADGFRQNSVQGGSYAGFGNNRR